MKKLLLLFPVVLFRFDKGLISKLIYSEGKMKTLISTCILLFLLSFLYFGCSKDDSTPTGNTVVPISVDFTITYQITQDTCKFYFTPSLDNHIDTLRAEYPAMNYNMLYTGSPTFTFNANVAYYFEWWYQMPRPATWKFTFIGRKVSDNSRYQTVKDFTVP
jgi:hypothetical protein